MTEETKVPEQLELDFESDDPIQRCPYMNIRDDDDTCEACQ